MYRPFLLTGFLIAPLLTAFSGCGGSPEVVQTAPPPAVSAAASGSGSESQASAMTPPSEEVSSDLSNGGGATMGDNAGGPPIFDMNQGSGGGPPGIAGMASSGNPEMPQFNMNQGSGSGGPPGMAGMAMGGSSDYSMGGAGGMANMNMGAMGGASNMGMGGMGMDGMMGAGQLAPPEDPAPDEDADYLTKGRYAFSIGKEKEALEYARAFAIASAEGADVLQKSRWFSAGLRPVTATRFAVGVVLEAPASMTDFKPIGSKQLQSAGGGGGGGSGREGMMMGGPGSAAQNKNTKAKEHSLYDLTGSFGEAVVAGFQERWAAGNFGTVYNDVEKLVPKTPVANNGMGMGGMRGGPPGGMGAEGMAGMGGMGMGGMGMSGDGQTASRERIMPGSVVVPGMVYLGTSEKQADLMKKAEDRGVDLVFLFDVKVSPPNRLNGIVQNEAKVRVVSLKGDPLARSSELLNTEVERALMRASGDDEVAKATDKFLAQFDSKVKLSDMPALKPEHAKARLVQVLSNTKLSKLEKLFEAALYHSMNLITDDEKLTACLIVMEGSEGESLANGRPEDKQAVLDTLLPNFK